MTGQELVNQSLRLLGMLASGESPSTDESNDGLVAANQLLSGWTAMGTPIYQVTRDAHSLTGAASYTIGSGATINTTRPIRIKAASVTKSDIAKELEIVDAKGWAGIMDKSRTGTFGDVLFYDGGYPTGTIYISPKPTSGSSLELDSYKPLTAIALLATTINLPPGYERALKYGLAIDLAGEYGVTVSPQLQATADAAIAAISQLNALILGDLPAAPPAAA